MKRKIPWYLNNGFLILCLFLLINGFTQGQKLEKLPPATHSELGVEHTQLVKIKEINSSYDDDVILARPTAITVDNSGNFYVYDIMLMKISKFDKNYKYITSFLRGGRGPGETGGGTGNELGENKIYYAPDSNIYVSDPLNNKVIVFSTQGKHLKDIKLDTYARKPFSPVVDSQGHLYAINKTGGIIDELDLGNQATLLHTYLEGRLSNNYLIFKQKFPEAIPKHIVEEMSSVPDLSDVSYDVTRDNKLIIFLRNPSTVYIFKDKKLVLQKNIFIQSVMDNYKKVAIKTLNSFKKMTPQESTMTGYGPKSMFLNLVVDKDDDHFFYLTEFYENLNIYKFNQKGELIKILYYSEKNIHVLAKRNKLFYGLSRPNSVPVIFKEEMKKKEERKR